jgi:cytochrome c oxidase subunit IV
VKFGSFLFLILTVFFGVTTPIYYLMSQDPTGTTALVLATALCILISFYLYVTSRRLPPLPEDDENGEISDIAGEYGFFSPYSWWPLACAASFATFVLGIGIGYWLMVIGGAFGIASLLGLVFEYYRRDFQH